MSDVSSLRKFIFFVAFFCFVFIFLKTGFTYKLSKEIIAGNASIKQYEYTQLENFTGKSRLKVNELLTLVAQKNMDIFKEKLVKEISKENIRKAESIFEPVGKYSLDYEDSKTPNTAEEYFDRNQRDIYTEQNLNYSLSLEQLLPTGGQLEVSYNLDHDKNDLIDTRYNGDESFEDVTLLNTSITQPLLKNAGTKVTKANINIAKSNKEISDQEFRKKQLQIFARALSSYWDLYAAQKKYLVHRHSLVLTRKLFQDTQELIKAGKLPSTETYDVRSGLVMRKTMLEKAKQNLVKASNSLRTLFSSSAQKNPRIILTDAELKIDKHNMSYPQALQKALNNRPEYLQAKKKAERENIRLVYAKNQRYPQLDLKASFGFNGLDFSPEKSFTSAVEDDYNTWSVGLQFSYPLFGDKKSNSELRIVRKKKKRALLEIKSLQVVITNSISSSLNDVQSSLKQVQGHDQNVNYKQKLMEIEYERLRAGKSYVRRLLEREMDLNRALNDRLQAKVDYRKAVVRLKKAKGTLLKDYGLEKEE